MAGFGAEHDSVAGRVEAADQALGGAMLGDAVEVVGAEVGKSDGTLQHAEGDDQPGHGPGSRHCQVDDKPAPNAVSNKRRADP